MKCLFTLCFGDTPLMQAFKSNFFASTSKTCLCSWMLQIGRSTEAFFQSRVTKKQNYKVSHHPSIFFSHRHVHTPIPPPPPLNSQCTLSQPLLAISLAMHGKSVNVSTLEHAASPGECPTNVDQFLSFTLPTAQDCANNSRTIIYFPVRPQTTLQRLQSCRKTAFAMLNTLQKVSAHWLIGV